MARDLSASPWRSAAIAPLLTPLAMLMLAVLEAVAEHKPLGPTGDIAENFGLVLVVWLVAYLYMWLLAVPVMLLTRRWITWSWLRLMVLGALLAALPWIVVPVSELRGRTDLSFLERLGQALHALLFMDGYIVPKLAALGAFVAGVFCILQMYGMRAPSNNALGIN